MNECSWKSLLHCFSLAAMLVSPVARSEPTGSLPATLITYEKPAYPAELQATAVIDGYATVAFVVDPSGLISDSVVLEASHAAFGASVLDALPTWHFEPSTTASLPRREVIRFEFASKGVVTSVSHRDALKAAFPLTARQRTPIRTVQWKELTTPPERLSAPIPNPATTKSIGKVAVSFIVDTAGRVRVPFIINATQPELGVATLAAVKQWQFTPPMHEGVPVLVEDVRSFTFGNSEVKK